MTILISADWHFSEHPRDAYRLELFKTLKPLLTEHKVTYLYCLGDLTEQKDNHGAVLVNAVADGFAGLTKHCNIIILRGNHDGLTAQSPFFQFLSKLAGITYVSKPYRAGPHLFLPHTHDPQHDWKGGSFNTVTHIFTHMTFAGAQGGNGVLAGVARDLLPERIPIISGDVHIPQRQGDITYVGAPYRIDFGDEYDPRVLILYDNDKIKSVPVEGRQKRLVTLDGLPTGAHGTNPEDIVKVRLPIKQSDYAKWPEYVMRVRQWGEQRMLYVDSVQPIVQDDNRISRKRNASPQLSDEELMHTYCKSRGVDDKTLQTGLKLLV